MKRYPAFEPPEYVGFKADPKLVAEFGQRTREDSERRRIVEAIDRQSLLRFYEGLLRFRIHDIMLQRWVRQGVITKAWLGTGEEAVTIGTTHALESGDSAGPMIRNAGVCHELGMSLADMFRGYLATADSTTRGRDLHIGDISKGVIAPISHVGSLVPVCAGIALSFKLRHEPRVAVTYVGDGAVRTAEFHEGMSFAAAKRLPFIAVVQNNQVALGTRREDHSLPGSLEELHKAYGVTGLACDGNNVLDVFAAMSLLVKRARDGEGASVLLANTFRMGGHATHDEAEGRRLLSDELFAHWGARDPIGLYEAWLLAEKHAKRKDLETIEQSVTDEVEAAAELALLSRESAPPDPATVTHGVYADDH